MNSYPKIKLENVGFGFNGKLILKNISFSVKNQELVAVIGQNGVGKTTLFNLISGLYQATGGQILIDGEQNNLLGKSSYMFQKDLLLPWRNLQDNLNLGLEIKKIKPKKIPKIFGLEKYLDYYPRMLSGGLRQKAALARTFLTNSTLMLLDEPFSSLDAISKIKMQIWLDKIFSRLKPTILLITHDISEAVFLVDKIIILGKSPAQIIHTQKISFPRPRPANLRFLPKFNTICQKLYRKLEKDC